MANHQDQTFLQKHLKTLVIVSCVLGVGFVAFRSSMESVDPTQMVVFSTLNHVDLQAKGPGLYWRIPLFQKAYYFDMKQKSMTVHHAVDTHDGYKVIPSVNINFQPKAENLHSLVSNYGEDKVLISTQQIEFPNGTLPLPQVPSYVDIQLIQSIQNTMTNYFNTLSINDIIAERGRVSLVLATVIQAGLQKKDFNVSDVKVLDYTYASATKNYVKEYAKTQQLKLDATNEEARQGVVKAQADNKFITKNVDNRLIEAAIKAWNSANPTNLLKMEMIKKPGYAPVASIVGVDTVVPVVSPGVGAGGIKLPDPNSK